MRARDKNGIYANEYSLSKVQEGIRLLNGGYNWHEASSAVGMCIENLRKRATKEGIKFRRGRNSLRRFSVRLNLPTETNDLAYLAALLDSEGYICIAKLPRNLVKVGITNTDLPIMNWLSSMGGKVIKRKEGVGKPCYVWNLYSRLDTRAFLIAVVPYMRIKKVKAEEAIKLISSWIDSELEFRNLEAIQA